MLLVASRRRSGSIISISPSCSEPWPSEKVDPHWVDGWDKRYSHALKHINCFLVIPLITVTPLSAFPVAHLQLAGTVTPLYVNWAHFAASIQTLLGPERWKTNPKTPHISLSIPMASWQALIPVQAGQKQAHWVSVGRPRKCRWQKTCRTMTVWSPQSLRFRLQFTKWQLTEPVQGFAAA